MKNYFFLTGITIVSVSSRVAETFPMLRNWPVLPVSLHGAESWTLFRLTAAILGLVEKKIMFINVLIFVNERLNE